MKLSNRSVRVVTFLASGAALVAISTASCRKVDRGGEPGSIEARRAALTGSPPLKAFLSRPVTVDGALADGEWEDASVQSFEVCDGGNLGRLYLKNDATTLYVALQLDDALWLPGTAPLVGPQLQQGIIHPGGQDNDVFATRIAIDGDTLLVGAPGEQLGTGAAYVYVRAGGIWTQQQRLVAPDGAVNDRFGDSVWLKGDMLLVAAPLDDDRGPESGSSHVFTRSAGVWTHTQKLIPPAATSSGARFGPADIEGSLAIIGAPGNTSGQGVAYAYHLDQGQWQFDAPIDAPDGATGDNFGAVVAIDGDLALISAYGDDDHGTQSGAAYLFQRVAQTWTFSQKITAPDAAADEVFSVGLRMRNGQAFIPAPGSASTPNGAGAVYAYERSGSTLTFKQKIESPDGEPGSAFGTSIGYDGAFVAIGAPFFPPFGDPNKLSGAVFLFSKVGGVWTYQTSLAAPHAPAGDNFGFGTSVSGRSIAVGAPGMNSAKGEAYVYLAQTTQAPLEPQPDTSAIRLFFTNPPPQANGEENNWSIRLGDGFVLDGSSPDGASLSVFSDELWGGSTNVVGAITHSNPVASQRGTVTVELKGPLNSGDPRDFGLQVGSRLGLTLRYDSSDCVGDETWTFPSVVVPVCGDGLLGPGEECDDGNGTDADGCSDDCIVEAGFVCPSPGFPCFVSSTGFAGAPGTTPPPQPEGAIVISGQADVNLALNPTCTGFPSPLESDHGWGSGTSQCDIVDGRTSYDTFARGLAFTGGHFDATGGAPWGGEPAGERHAVIDFGQPRTFHDVTIWWHGVEYTPATGVLESWNGSSWVTILGAHRQYLALHAEGSSSGYSDADLWSFPAVTGSKVRFTFDNSGNNVLGTFNIHGWIYEMEVWGPGEGSPPASDGGTSVDAGAPADDGGGADGGPPVQSGAPNGDPCALGDECASGFCADGVCCGGACGGDAQDDCQACAAALGASADGQCTTLPSTHVCREAVDVCDFEETCAGVAACPADVIAPAATCDAANPGLHVSVDLYGGDDTPGGITLTFDRVVSGGSVTVTEAPPASPPPSGYKFVKNGTTLFVWDLTTTTTYLGSIKFCFNYENAGVTPAEVATLQLVHDNGATTCQATDGTPTPWCNITMSFPEPGVICGTTTSLSPFALVARLADTAPPVFGPAPPVFAYATSAAGAVVTYASPTTTDAIDGDLPVTCTPMSGTSFRLGLTPVTCSATDGAGNEGTTAFTVSVSFQAPTDGTFFLPPINPDGSSIFKLGSTVPVKFKLTGVSAAISNLVARLSVVRISNGVTGTELEAASNGAASDGDLFRYDAVAGQYIFNLSTKPLSAGTWSLRADLGDGVSHEIRISLRK